MGLRVVVTGLGVVTALGSGREVFWRNLLSGHSGFGPVEAFDTRPYKVHHGAEVKSFRPEEYGLRLSPTRLGRASQFAVAAARLALTDAALASGSCDPERLGVAFGTTSGEAQIIERFNDCCLQGNPGEMEVQLASLYPSHTLAAHVAAEIGAGGIVTVLPAACAAGNYAVASAYDAIRAGRSDVMLAGGADAFSRITFTGFARLGAIAPVRCQPFDRNRKGIIPGEGAAVLVLERLDAALARQASIYAEVAGYGQSCDAHHATSMPPDASGAVQAMRHALKDAGLQPSQVRYVSAHGTGTPTNDRLETLAIKTVFGEAAYSVPISSVKSMLGHAMGAASAIEAVVCALAVHTDHIPPTMNLEDPDPECDLDYVPDGQRLLSVEVALNNAYGFGGCNSSLVLKKCEV